MYAISCWNDCIYSGDGQLRDEEVQAIYNAFGGSDPDDLFQDGYGGVYGSDTTFVSLQDFINFIINVKDSKTMSAATGITSSNPPISDCLSSPPLHRYPHEPHSLIFITLPPHVLTGERNASFLLSHLEYNLDNIAAGRSATSVPPALVTTKEDLLAMYDVVDKDDVENINVRRGQGWCNFAFEGETHIQLHEFDVKERHSCHEFDVKERHTYSCHDFDVKERHTAAMTSM